jgi:hypothetical protein
MEKHLKLLIKITIYNSNKVYYFDMCEMTLSININSSYLGYMSTPMHKTFTMEPHIFRLSLKIEGTTEGHHENTHNDFTYNNFIIITILIMFNIGDIIFKWSYL